MVPNHGLQTLINLPWHHWRIGPEITLWNRSNFNFSKISRLIPEPGHIRVPTWFDRPGPFLLIPVSLNSHLFLFSRRFVLMYFSRQTSTNLSVIWCFPSSHFDRSPHQFFPPKGEWMRGMRAYELDSSLYHRLAQIGEYRRSVFLSC